MIAKTHIPAFPLNQFIDHFFYYSGFNPDHVVDRFLPDGEVQMIFDFTDYPKYIYDNHSLKEIQSCKRVWFSGFRTEPITIPSGKESEMLIVQFRKGKAYPFLSEPMQGLTNYVVDAELVLKIDILSIREQLLNAQSICDKFKQLEQRLLRYYTNRLDVHPFTDFAINQILHAPDHCSVKDISAKAGYSHKHIIKLFKQHVGVTLKDFIKVIRFQRALLQIDQQKKVDWMTIAFDCGFYDQSHFIADFKSFSGFTPTEYLNLRGETLNYIPVK